MKNTQYHFIGIGGVGMSSLARILLEKGMQVSGSDTRKTPVIEQLIEANAHIHIGHHADHIKPNQIVIYSSAIDHSNSEFIRAKQLQCVLWHRADLLRWLARNYQSLVVCGAHGKTTCTALLSHVLYTAGLDPSFSFGGYSPSFTTNGHSGYGNFFVMEGDESDGSFLNTDPFAAIVTNIDDDHLDYWKDKDSIFHAFVDFLLKVKRKDLIVWNHDDELLKALSPSGVSFGIKEGADFRAINIRQNNARMLFDLQTKEHTYKDIDLCLLGALNVLNASATFALCISLKIPETAIRLSFSSFKGVSRRLEKKGESNGITFYDDYAHHPSEIRLSLQAMRQMYEARNMVVIFQPHRYSRIKHLMPKFKHAFAKANRVILTDIYSAGEKPIEGINEQTLAKHLHALPSQRVEIVKREQIEDYLKKQLKPEDIVITMGAGDVFRIADNLLKSTV